MEKETKTAKEKKKKNDFRPFLWIALIVIVIWVISWILIDLNYSSSDRGAFGDKFGAVNALFSGLALAGVIFAIILQKQELELQREELKETKDEIRLQRIESERQNNTLSKQRFENTFFQMINLHHEIISMMDYKTREAVSEGKGFRYLYEEVTFQGRMVFQKATGSLSDLIQRELEDYLLSKKMLKEEISELSIEMHKEYIEKAYRTFYDQEPYNYSITFGHYFRNLYYIFKNIYLTDLITEEEKNQYASIVRGQISKPELYNIFYYTLYEGLQNEKYLYLIKEFNLIKYFDKELIPQYHIELFKNASNTVQNPFK